MRRLIPKNLHLLKLIRRKRESYWKPTVEQSRKGFRRWHQRGYLPHFDAPHVTQMVTFMLADSFPVTRRAEWAPILREPDDSLKRRKLEEWLDRGHGHCWLRREKAARLAEEVLLEKNGREFQFQAWVIMPNHVHLVVDVWDVPLTKLVGSWKGKSSRIINLALNRQGSLWQEDYFDTVVRDEAHLKKAVRYTEVNPAKACFVKNPRDWRWSSARMRDEFERLPWQRQHASERGVHAA